MLFVAATCWAQQTAPGIQPRDTSDPQAATARQSNVPPQAQQAEDELERTARRFRMGVEAGAGIDPELIMFGVHGTFAPVFKRGIAFRPGLLVGVGEVTTTLGINLDFIYTLPGPTRRAGWAPYIGAGPSLGLGHRGFEADAVDVVDQNRFDFGDTDFEGGLNFIVGARRTHTFFEMKATAYGVSNVQLLAGFTF